MGALAVPLRVIVEARAWSSLLLLASRLPLGLVYFLLPAALGVAGVVLLPVGGVGLVVLVLALAVTWAMAAFERQLARWWLGVEVPPRSPPAGEGSWRARLRGFVTNPVAWKSLAYLLLQLPLGVVVFPLFAGGAAAALAAMISPLVYLVFVVGARPADFNLAAFAGRIGIAAGGALLGLLVLHMARLAGRGYGLLVQLMLGMGTADLQLATARSEAAAEHARAEDLERKRRELIVSMSHELRTPAASIRGHAEALLSAEAPLSEEERRRFLQVLAREAGRVGALTDDLLSIARTDAGGPQLDLGPVDVAEVVEHVRAAMTPIAGKDREITLTTAVAPGVAPAWADRDRLSQVLMNLVRNAITYTPDGGIVSIQLTGAGDSRIAMAVEDTGIGIEPQDLDRIFERFYRTDASRSRLTGGFGLGLAISRDLVEAMGGTIEAESRPGSGSRFTVLLRRAG